MGRRLLFTERDIYEAANTVKDHIFRTLVGVYS